MSAVWGAVGPRFVAAAPPPPKWRTLLGAADFTGWDTYMAGRPPNQDPRGVFKMTTVDGESVVSVSGEEMGTIATRETFANYHLTVDFKYGRKSFRKASYIEGGVFYHSFGAPGKYGVLPSVEFCIGGNGTGSFWSVETVVDSDGVTPEEAGPAELARFKTWEGTCCKNTYRFVYRKGGKTITLRSGGFMHAPDTERPAGEWNTIEVYCVGDASAHVVNGTVVSVLRNIRRSENGRDAPLRSGRIQLQCEGGEIYYRRVRMRPITALPGGQ